MKSVTFFLLDDFKYTAIKGEGGAAILYNIQPEKSLESSLSGTSFGL